MVWMIVYFVGGFLFLSFLIGAGLTDNPKLRSMADWWLLPSGILAFAVTIVFKLWKRAKERREFQQHEVESDRQAKEEEARRLTAQLVKIRQSSVQLTAQIPQRLHDANGWLQSAEQRWRENALDLFWEAVQNGTAHLAQFCANAQELAANAERYYDALRGRRHTFPPFPVQPAALPNPLPVVEKLQSIVRCGQASEPFAATWEEYKTHRLAKHGFSTLEEAVVGLPEAAIGVTEALKRAISTDIETR